MRDIRRDKEAVKAALEKTALLFASYMKDFFDAGVDLVEIAEPVASGDMVSKAHFEEFVVPAVTKLTRLLPDTICELHVCGSVSDRLSLMAETGAKLISLDYKVNLGTARRELGGKVAFSGNIDPVDVLAQSFPEDVTTVTRKAIEDAGGIDGFILMPGCDISPLTPKENLLAMIGEGKRYTSRTAT